MLYNDPVYLNRVEKLSARCSRLGGSEKLFEQHGRNQLVAFLSQGGFPWHKVLDAGCGVLRGGYWFIHFLNTGNYFGLETTQRENSRDIEFALEELFDKSVVDHKKPTFHHNDNLDYSLFRQKFDYVIMRSLWTHFSPAYVEMSLDAFLKHKTEKGIFLTTYFRTMDIEVQHSTNGPHKSAEYTFEWIEEICDKRSLRVSEFHLGGCFGSPGISVVIGDNQTWLRIESK